MIARLLFEVWRFVRDVEAGYLLVYETRPSEWKRRRVA
jgi:hypothetical protein